MPQTIGDLLAWPGQQQPMGNDGGSTLGDLFYGDGWQQRDRENEEEQRRRQEQAERIGTFATDTAAELSRSADAPPAFMMSLQQRDQLENTFRQRYRQRFQDEPDPELRGLFLQAHNATSNANHLRDLVDRHNQRGGDDEDAGNWVLDRAGIAALGGGPIAVPALLAQFAHTESQRRDLTTAMEAMQAGRPSERDMQVLTRFISANERAHGHGVGRRLWDATTNIASYVGNFRAAMGLAGRLPGGAAAAGLAGRSTGGVLARTAAAAPQALMATPFMAPQRIAEMSTPQVDVQRGEGGAQFQGQTPEYFGGGPGSTILAGTVSAAIENLTETAGGRALAGLGGHLGRTIARMPVPQRVRGTAEVLGNYLRLNPGQSVRQMAGRLDDAMRRINPQGYQGFFTELGEERLSEIAQGLAQVGDWGLTGRAARGDVSGALQGQLEEAAAFGLFVLAGGSPGIIRDGMTRRMPGQGQGLPQVPTSGPSLADFNRAIDMLDVHVNQELRQRQQDAPAVSQALDEGFLTRELQASGIELPEEQAQSVFARVQRAGSANRVRQMFGVYNASSPVRQFANHLARTMYGQQTEQRQPREELAVPEAGADLTPAERATVERQVQREGRVPGVFQGTPFFEYAQDYFFRWSQNGGEGRGERAQQPATQAAPVVREPAIAPPASNIAPETQAPAVPAPVRSETPSAAPSNAADPFAKIDQSQRDFIEGKIREAGSLQAVNRRYGTDSAVHQYYRMRAAQIYGGQPSSNTGQLPQPPAAQPIVRTGAAPSAPPAGRQAAAVQFVASTVAQNDGITEAELLGKILAWKPPTGYRKVQTRDEADELVMAAEEAGVLRSDYSAEMRSPVYFSMQDRSARKETVPEPAQVEAATRTERMAKIAAEVEKAKAEVRAEKEKQGEPAAVRDPAQAARLLEVIQGRQAKPAPVAEAEEEVFEAGESEADQAAATARAALRDRLLASRAKPASPPARKLSDAEIAAAERKKLKEARKERRRTKNRNYKKREDRDSPEWAMSLRKEVLGRGGISLSSLQGFHGASAWQWARDNQIDHLIKPDGQALDTLAEEFEGSGIIRTPDSRNSDDWLLEQLVQNEPLAPSLRELGMSGLLDKMIEKEAEEYGRRQEEARRAGHSTDAIGRRRRVGEEAANAETAEGEVREDVREAGDEGDLAGEPRAADAFPGDVDFDPAELEEQFDPYQQIDKWLTAGRADVDAMASELIELGANEFASWQDRIAARMMEREGAAETVDKILSETKQEPTQTPLGFGPGWLLGQTRGDRIDTGGAVLTPEEIKSKNPEVERRLQQTEGLNRPSALQKIREWSEAAWRGLTRANYHVPKTTRFDSANEIFRLIKAVPSVAQDKASRMLLAITNTLGGPKNMKLFSRKVLIDNLRASVEAGQPLRFGFESIAEVIEYQEQLDALIATTPNVQDSLALRKRLNRAHVAELVERKLLSEKALENVETYYHQQVNAKLEMIRQSQGHRLKRKERTFQRSRLEGVESLDEEYDYNTLFIESEYGWLADSLTEIEKDKLEKKLAEVYDIFPAKHAEGMKLADIVRDNPGYAAWTPAPGQQLYPSISVAEQVAEHLQKQLLDMGQEEGDIGEEEMMAALALLERGGRFRVYPVEIVSQLNSLVKDAPGEISQFLTKLMGWWKQWTLLNPKRLIAYNLRNITGDLDPLLGGAPGALQYTAEAAKELRGYYLGEETALSEDLREARDLGVIESGMTANQIPDVRELDVFYRFFESTDRRNIAQRIASAPASYFQFAKKYTAFRESIMRLAAYKHYKRGLRSGAIAHYGGARQSTVKQLAKELGNDVAAAHLARNLLGDYGNMTVFGKWLSEHLVPFHSWNEVNFKRFPRMVENAVRYGVNKGKDNPAAVGTYAAVGLMGIGALSAAAYVFNMLFAPDDDEKLDPLTRATPHITLGHNADGSVVVFREIGAIGHLMKWFGLDKIIANLPAYRAGQMSVAQLLGEQARGTANQAAQGLRPDIKAPFEVGGGLSFFPDIFNPRRQDRLQAAGGVLGLGQEAAFLRGQIMGTGELGQANYWQRFFGASTQDPRRNNLGQVFDLIGRFEAQNGRGGQRPVLPESTIQGMRNAAYADDFEAFRTARDRFMEDGRTLENFNQSLSNMDPLSRMDKDDEPKFRAFLTPAQRQELDRAQAFSQEMRVKLWQWWHLAAQQSGNAGQQAEVNEDAGRVLYNMTTPRPARQPRETAGHYHDRVREWQQTVERARSSLGRLNLSAEERRRLLNAEWRRRGYAITSPSFRERAGRLR